MERKTFICANKACHYMSRQPISHVSHELGEYKLCKDCRKRGMVLKQGVMVVYENGK